VFQIGQVSSYQLGGLAFDGQSLWVAATVTIAGLSVELLVKVRASDGAIQSYVHIATTSIGYLTGVAFDGTNIWVGQSASPTNIIKVRPGDGVILDTIPVSGNPIQLAFDGTNIWSASDSAGRVNITNGDTRTNTSFGVGSGNGSAPQAIAFDGTNMWVPCYSDNKVIKIAPDGSTLGAYTVGSGPASVVFDGANIWVGNS